MLKEVSEILLERRFARRINKVLKDRARAIERGDFAGTQSSWNRLCKLQQQRRAALARVLQPNGKLSRRALSQ